MKTEHFPSLELCTKLTEAGFPETKMRIGKIKGEVVIMPIDINNLQYDYFYGKNRRDSSVLCPSVMEMLDVMQRKIEEIDTGDKYTWGVMFYRTKNLSENRYRVVVGQLFEIVDTLPNALAEMILWLHKNNYISFTK